MKTKDYYTILENLIRNLRKFFNKEGYKKAVIGISGGIDSAVVACIAVLALGKENVIGVSMPGPYTSEETFSDAATLMNDLDIVKKEISIVNIYNAYKSSTELSEISKNKADENLFARIRGNILMWLANENNALVLATGNKTEAMMGYCTLYGDTVGAVEVIGNLYKKDVYGIAKVLSKYKWIPESIITRPPSAEIKPNQTDEDDLGITYEKLDSILERIENNQFKRDLCAPNLSIEEEI